MNYYKVSLYTSPGNIPFNFARHLWFVIEEGSLKSRWEILFRKNACETSWGHLHKNLHAPEKGIEMLPYLRKYYWKGKLVGSIEGEDDSLANKVFDFIQNSPFTYPYCYKYSLKGPNSNTYAGWVLQNFPEFKIKLPMNAIGKNYKIK